MDFSWGSHSRSYSDNSSESKENMKPPKQKNVEDKSLENKKRNHDQIASENEENIITSDGGTNVKSPKSREEHILVDKGKRKKLNDMFNSLHALLPILPSKLDKAGIVDEAVNYIKDLEQTLENLEKQKRQKPGPQCVLKQIMATPNALSTVGKQQVAFNTTWAASNMVLNILGEEAQFSICSAHKPGLMTMIASVLENHKIDVITSSISCNDNGNGSTCMIQVHGKRASDANSVEETYRQVAEEIMAWIT